MPESTPALNFTNSYMAAIKPFRRLIIYPAIMRRIELDWRKPTHELMDETTKAGF